MCMETQKRAKAILTKKNGAGRINLQTILSI